MTKTFERFLRSFSDKELVRFAEERGAMRPPYWRVLQLGLQIEMSRRGLALDEDLLGPAASIDPEPSTRSVGA